MERDSRYALPDGTPRRRMRTIFLGSRERSGASVMGREEFFGHVGQLVTDIRELKGGNEGWWVVGSLGRAAAMGQEFDHVREDGSVRDVDVLFSVPNLPISNHLWRNNRTPIHVGTGFGNYVHVEPGVSAKLVFGPVEQEVPLEAFPTVMANVGGVDFPTLPAETLFHLQAARHKWRNEDLRKMVELAKFIRDQGESSQYPESLYGSFHEYMNKLKAAQIDRSLSFRLKELGDRYQTSWLNKVVPVNCPLIRRPMEEAWVLIGKTQRNLQERKEKRT